MLKDHVAGGWLSRAILAVMDDVGNRRHGVALPHHYLSGRQWRSTPRSGLGLTVDEERRALGLYPWWADWLFGRTLHFVARLGVPRR